MLRFSHKHWRFWSTSTAADLHSFLCERSHLDINSEFCSQREVLFPSGNSGNLSPTLLMPFNKLYLKKNTRVGHREHCFRAMKQTSRHGSPSWFISLGTPPWSTPSLVHIIGSWTCFIPPSDLDPQPTMSFVCLFVCFQQETVRFWFELLTSLNSECLCAAEDKLTRCRSLNQMDSKHHLNINWNFYVNCDKDPGQRAPTASLTPPSVAGTRSTEVLLSPHFSGFMLGCQCVFLFFVL